MDRLETNKLADLAVWAMLALIAWRVVEASCLASWRQGFKAGFNAAPLAARSTQEVKR